MTPRGPFSIPPGINLLTRNQTRATCSICAWVGPWKPTHWEATLTGRRHHSRVHGDHSEPQEARHG